MINLIIFCFLILFYQTLMATEITTIELHNKSIDQLVEEVDVNSKNEMIDELTLSIEKINEKNNTQEDSEENIENVSSQLVNELPALWETIDKNELLFLFENISNINSQLLKSEFISVLDINQSYPDDFNEDDFNKLIIDVLLRIGDRKKAYDIISSLQIDEKNEHKIFYKEFLINYLLSTYNLNESCSLRNQIKDMELENQSNFFLKVDIFCLVLQEKFDEANLLNSLMIESGEIDNYFQLLFEKLQNSELSTEIIYQDSVDDNIFLYSAMHRIGNIPLNSKFLESDPINLSMPIILSSSTEIDLRIKSAHYAFLNKLIGIDSLAALYQTVDFTYEDLNNSKEFIESLESNVELSMAFFYQLINIQLLPSTRLDAIIKFWDFAEKNDLEKIAYSLSLKNLNTIEPSDDLVIFGPRIARAYIANKNFEKANLWLLFSENLLKDQDSLNLLNSIKLSLSLSSYSDNQNFNDILISNLKQIKDEDKPLLSETNELLYHILSSLEVHDNDNFVIDKKITDKRQMPSFYLLNMIRKSLESKNEIELLLSIIVSVQDKSWTDLHPEHFRLVLLALKEYKQGIIFNDILLEVLKNNKIL